MSKLREFKKHLKKGKVYRRAELEKWSNSVDRHLHALVGDGTLESFRPVSIIILKSQFLAKRLQKKGNLYELF